jgi:hypothetical protein
LAGILLVVASLSFLAGCQGFSTGSTRGNQNQQLGALSLMTTTLNFGSVASGSSKTMTVNATNSGAAAVTVSSAVFSTSYFSFASPSLPTTIGAGQTIPMSITFTPNAAGTFNASVGIASDASDATVNLVLTGTGTGTGSGGGGEGTLTPNPASETFPNTTVGAQQPESFTLTNTGTASLTISQASLTGSAFQLSGITPPITLGVSQSTSFSVTFAPQSTGSASGTVTIASDGSNPTLTVGLSGTGIASVAGQLSASSVAVGSVVVGTSETGSGSLTASGTSVMVTAASSNNAAFSISGLALPVTIPAGSSVPFTVTFDPQATGSASATLSFASNAQTSPTTAQATGNGIAAPTYSVNLSWTASSSQNISGYNVYRAPYSGSCGSFAKINPNLNTGTLYTDTVVQDGSAYCYATTAVNTSNEESSDSNIVSNIQIPAP